MKVTMEENTILEMLHNKIEVPCPLQWSLPWLCAPTILNFELVANGHFLPKFREKMAYKT